MQYCTKCGKKLSSDAHFCASCGTSVKQQHSTGTDADREHKHVFIGAIAKYLNCGEQIATDVTKCPVCGFVVEKRNVSAFLDAFVKQFTSFKEDTAKRDFIENYAIPNNKEDMRDLLNYAANQRDKVYADDDSKVYWVDAWNNKCRQIVNQALDTFGMDEGFSAWLKNYKAGVEISSAENEKLKQKLRAIEAGKKRAASAKKFLKGFGSVVAMLVVLGLSGFGIKTCTDKRTAEEKIRQQELTQLKTDTIKLLAKEIIIPKKNVFLRGLLSTYCEVIGDAKIMYRFKEDYDEIRVGALVGVPVRLKKDFSAAYKQQCEDFTKATFDTADRKISDYEFSTYTETVDSILEYDGNLSMEVLLGVKIGQQFELVDSGTFVNYSIDQKSKNKTAEMLAAYKTIKDKAQNLPEVLSLSMTAEIEYSLYQESEKKGYDSQTVDIY